MAMSSRSDAGTYTNDFATIDTRITLQGVGGMVTMLATVSPPNGKAIFVTNTDVTIDRFAFTGVSVPSMNGSGIRYQGGHLVVTNSHFHGNQQGILSNPDPSGSITIRNTEFGHNGAGNGYSHNLYIGAVGSLTIEGSYFHHAVVGHQIKSRALSTTITDSRIADGPAGTGAYSIDLPNGGRAVLSRNFIEQGPRSGNPVIVAFGAEGNLHPDTSLRMAGNTILNDHPSPSVRLLWNATPVTATLTGNRVFGLSAAQHVNGPVSVSGMTTLATRPAFDTSSPWAPAAPRHRAPRRGAEGRIRCRGDTPRRLSAAPSPARPALPASSGTCGRPPPRRACRWWRCGPNGRAAPGSARRRGGNGR
jgi:hypothetical protein